VDSLRARPPVPGGPFPVCLEARLSGYPWDAMLPPPDPYETPGPPHDLELTSPWAVFLSGPPGDEQTTVSEAVLRFRPGLLFVADA
jgi:hypothetical protein